MQHTELLVHGVSGTGLTGLSDRVRIREFPVGGPWLPAYPFILDYFIDPVDQGAGGCPEQGSRWIL